jgi:hypothetical protein
MGRLLKAVLGGRFVSANVPMLHKRTLAATGQSEFRPGVVSDRQNVDLCDEFERQFFGDVMLFSVERLTSLGYPQRRLASEQVLETLDAMRAEMLAKYHARRHQMLENLGVLRSLLQDTGHWWHARADLVAALRRIDTFMANLAHNFVEDSPCYVRIEAPERWQDWRSRQLAAIVGLRGNQASWQQAMAVLRDSGLR